MVQIEIVARVVRECLDIAVVQPIAGSIIERSLANAGLGALPSDPARVGGFVLAHLLPECRRQAGAGAAARFEQALATKS